MKLKTLKDLPKIHHGHYEAISGVKGQNVLIDERKLKQETIKWVKVIEEKIKTIRELESKPQSPLQRVATQGLDEIF